jgi:NAD(P)H dehydrogenase (quinone)
LIENKNPAPQESHMKTLLVVAHPRRQSLTFAVADAFAAAIQERDHEIEWADLVREGFDPVVLEPDEPDWSNPDKRYSAPVDAEMARVERNAATVLVFPIWWWSMPAMLKGWIDRVWNNGWAYGNRFYPQRRVWMLAIAGVGEDAYKKRRYDEALRTQLEVGVLEYCGIAERRLEVMYGAIEGEPYPQRILARARALGLDF